jgi:predicted transcriptional regulator of viral defense system
MKAIKLNTIKTLYFSTADIARVLDISLESARVSATRYTKKGILVRLKRDLYVLPNRLPVLSESERFSLANIIQTPSYVSLTTALSYYGISTQQQQSFVESVTLKRTKSVSVEGLKFTYTRIKNIFYGGFEKLEDFFIATPEKALADAVYLTSLGRYTCDFFAIDFLSFNREKVQELIEKTNRTTRAFWERLCENFKI